MNAEIGKLKISDLECYGEFELIYIKNGKLNDVNAESPKFPSFKSTEFWWKLVYYFEELNENRNCKRILKKHFKLVTLQKYTQKYEVRRGITIINDTLIIIDNTKYK